MSVFRVRPFAPFMVAALLGCGSGPERAPHAAPAVTASTPADADATVATVDGLPISANAVRQGIVRRGGGFLSRFEKLEAKEQVLEELVRVKLLAQAARQQGYDRDPDIVASIDNLLADRYWREHVAQAGAVAQPTDAEVEAYYRAHTAEFVQPERVRGAIVFLAAPADASAAVKDALRARADDLRRQAVALPTSERTFGAIAMLNSADPTTRARGGDLGFIAREATVYDVERPVLDALVALQHPGDLAPPVETERGVYLVKFIERAGGAPVPLATVTARIRQRLYDERVQAAEKARYGTLRAQADVQIDRTRLQAIGPTHVASTERPPSFPVEGGTP